jgi:hypothetical protein
MVVIDPRPSIYSTLVSIYPSIIPPLTQSCHLYVRFVDVM